MPRCAAELCIRWTGQGCLCALMGDEPYTTEVSLARGIEDVENGRIRELPGLWEQSDLEGGETDESSA